LNGVLRYEFRPAGHEMKIERKDYVKTESKLCKVFEKWLDELDDSWDFWNRNYNKAVNMLKNIKPTVDEAHSALIAYQDHPRINIEHAGLFLSAVYNRVPDMLIVFDVDLDTPIDCLGYKLGKGKVLVNYCKVGWWMGREASGVVVNYGKCGNFMGSRASGVVVNCGNVEYRMGENASGKIIAIKNPKSFGNLKYAKLVLDEDDCRKIPELVKYFDELKAKIDEGRNNPELLLEMFGYNPAEKIRKDVYELLRRAGYWRW
jgi:hypothetical protein